MSRPGWRHAGAHDICERCDLYVHPEHGSICPRCGTPTVKCEGPLADPKSTTPPCLACSPGPEHAHAWACKLGGGKFWTVDELKARLAVLKAKLAEATS